MSNQHQYRTSVSIPSPYGTRIRIPPPPPILRKSPEHSSHSSRHNYRDRRASRSISRSPSPRRSYIPRSDPRDLVQDRNRSSTSSRRQHDEQESSNSSSRHSRAGAEPNRREEHRHSELEPKRREDRYPQTQPDGIDRREEIRVSRSDSEIGSRPTPNPAFSSSTSLGKTETEQEKKPLTPSANTSYLMSYASAPASNPTDSDSSVVRTIVNPELVKIPRRADEGTKPIFDREDLKEAMQERIKADNVEQNPPPPVIEQRVVAIIREPVVIPPPQFLQPIPTPTIVPIPPNSHYPTQTPESFDIKPDYRTAYKLKNREAPPRHSISPQRSLRSISPVMFEREPSYNSGGGSRRECIRRPSPIPNFEPNHRRVVIEGRAPVEGFRSQRNRSRSISRSRSRSPMEDRPRVRQSRSRSMSPMSYEMRIGRREKPSGDLRDRLSNRNELLEGPSARRGRGPGRGRGGGALFRGSVSRRRPNIHGRIGMKRPY